MLRAVDDEAALRDRVTSICRALPEISVDEGHHPHRGYKVEGKNLGWFTVNEHGTGRIVLVVRAEAKENEALVSSPPSASGLPSTWPVTATSPTSSICPIAPSTGTR